MPTHISSRPISRLTAAPFAALLLALVTCTSQAQVPTRAPEFTGINQWLNSKPLTMQDLRGKVVLIDFCAYSCINCLRTLPHVTGWYDRYKDKGLVVVGVHAPEFEFEKSTANVRKAIEKYGIHYPVAQDNDMATWRAWNNRFWPAEYLVDRDGKVVMHHYGEGHYEVTENAIRGLLGMEPMTGEVKDKDFSGVGSPEMYLGLARAQNQANPHALPRLTHTYKLPGSLALNRYALQGQWKLSDEYARQMGPKGAIRLRFRAARVNMVAASDKPVQLAITVDGKPQPPVTVHDSRLYTLYQASQPGEHVNEIRTSRAGLKAFTFTFA